MPTFGNTTIKKNDGTTDVLWTGINPQGGPGAPAVWRNLTVGNAMAHRPEFRTAAKQRGNLDEVTMTGKWSEVVTDTAINVQKTLGEPISFKLSMTVPKGISQTVVDEAASQFPALVVALKSQLKDRTAFV